MGIQMSRVLALIVVLTPTLAFGWEAEGLRSGMGVGEVTKIMLGRGESIKHKVAVGGRNNAYMLAVTSGWIAFCEDTLYGWDRVLPGGFTAFVALTERETKRLGRKPTLESITDAKFELIATWDLGQDLLQYALSYWGSKDPEPWRFSRNYEDTLVEQRCRR
jgi:hypothetical protein